MRILVIEDEPELAQLVRNHLDRLAFAVDLAASLDVAEGLLSTCRYDAIVLDRGLPDGDGLGLLRKMRANGDSTPVLAATARDQVIDRVQGLDLGVDDYLVKPYDLRELTARLRALLRRPGKALGTVLHAGNITLDTIRATVEIAEQPTVFARRQFVLLETLMRSCGRVVSRSVIEESLYGIDDLVESNALEANVSRLRRVLADMGATVAIHTVRGVGYMLAEEKTP
ncbi:MAG: response regulator transcription factor [Rhodospirillales bacterium]|nr:MAG: response regulator transcription factor [Rhodospirillales bacterium]